jgi:solute carrier family 66 (lysosomal lysine-arginine transporter), member 1
LAYLVDGRIIVYSPQILENYRLKSGEGLSVLFVVIWLLGDIANLVGAEMAGLLPTVIVLALYVGKILAFAQQQR